MRWIELACGLAAAVVLVACGGPPAGVALSSGESGGGAVRSNAALSGVEQHAAVPSAHQPELKPAAGNPPPLTFTSDSVWALSDNASDPALTLSLYNQLIWDADTQVQLAAIESLAEMSDARAVELLVQVVAAGEREVRSAAVYALLDVGSPAAHAALKRIAAGARGGGGLAEHIAAEELELLQDVDAAIP